MSMTFCGVDAVPQTVVVPTPVRQAAAPPTAADLEYRIAATFADRSAAFCLVYAAYLRRGLGMRNPHEMRVTPYHLLPTTEILFAQSGEEVVFTMSLVKDGQLGVPMEVVYGPEVAERRQRGLRFGEVSCLADCDGERSAFLPIMVQMSRLVVQYSLKQGLDELLIAVHPRHARFYRRFMGFEVIGGERSYPTVRNRPAIALCMNFASLARHRPECYEMFCGEQIPDERLVSQPIVDSAFTAAPLGDRASEAADARPNRRAPWATEPATEVNPARWQRQARGPATQETHRAGERDSCPGGRNRRRSAPRQ